MTEATNAPRKSIPAATVVIFRNCPDGGPPQLLMVQRAKEMRFAGGAVAFPGGRIDEADYVLAETVAPTADPLLTAARIAGIRETLEETGLAIGLDQTISAEEAANAREFLLKHGALAPVLERYGWSLDLDRLVHFARWCPDFDPSFDTHFFLSDVGTGSVTIAVDATENALLFWASAEDVLGMADRGEIRLLFPTRCNLERLARFARFDLALAHTATVPVRMIVPWMEDRAGETWLVISDDHGYPVTAQPLAASIRS